TVQAKSLYDLTERNRWQFIFEPGDGNQIVLLVIEKLRDSSLGVVRLGPTRASRKLGKPGFQSRGKAYGKHSQGRSQLLCDQPQPQARYPRWNRWKLRHMHRQENQAWCSRNRQSDPLWRPVAPRSSLITAVP